MVATEILVHRPVGTQIKGFDAVSQKELTRVCGTGYMVEAWLGFKCHATAVLKSNLIQSIGLVQQEHNNRNGSYTCSQCNFMYIVTNLLHQVLVYFCDVHVLGENNFVIEIILTLLKIARPLLSEIENLQWDTSVQCTCVLYMHVFKSKISLVRLIVYVYGYTEILHLLNHCLMLQVVIFYIR